MMMFSLSAAGLAMLETLALAAAFAIRVAAHLPLPIVHRFSVRVRNFLLEHANRLRSPPNQQSVEMARHASLQQFSASILDTYIPRCRRLTQLHFGSIVSNPDAPQAFTENVGYNMTYNLVEPFKGNALHTHPAVEVFVALDGRWEIAWGERGEQATVLAPGDLVAVPAGVRHSYKNIEPHTAQNILTILPGRASITWAPDVVSEARQHGARCTNDGVLLDFWSKAEAKQANQAAEEEEQPPEPQQPVPASFSHVPVSDAAMARYVRRKASGQPLVVQTPEGYLRTSWRTLGRGESLDARRAATAQTDLLVVVLGGDAELSCGREQQLVGSATRLDAVRIPAASAVSAAGHCRPASVTLTNRLPAPCTLLLVESQMRGLVGKQTDTWAISDAVQPPAKLSAFGSISPSSTLDALEQQSMAR